MQSSGGSCIFIRIIELKSILEGRIYNNDNIIKILLGYGKVPVLWRKFFLKVVNDIENLYNRPNRMLQHCYEKHLCKR